MAFRTSSGLVNFGSLAGVWRYDSSATSTISMTAGTGDLLKLSLQTVGEGFSFLKV